MKVLACAACLIALNLSALAAGASAPTTQRFDDDAEECLEAVPAAASVAGVLDDGRNVALDIHFVLDDITVGRAAEILEQMRYAYDPLKISLSATYQEVSFPAQKSAREFELQEPVPASDAAYLFQRTKEAVGGSRPAGSDVVYLLTDDAITGGTAGMADCIGGVRYANRAFGIGEEEQDTGGGLYFCCTLSTAKIAAHEIGHLMGAHHHYANCAEGAATKLDDQHLGTCTMMFNDVGLVNLRFSALEAAVVRGHAVKFADRAEPPAEPQPEPKPKPEPDPESEPVTHLRAVDLKLSRHLVARGVVRAGDAKVCYASVEVVLQRRSGTRWERVATRSTTSEGTFRFKAPDRPGRYRVAVAETTGKAEGRAYTCAAAASAPAFHRHAR